MSSFPSLNKWSIVTWSFLMLNLWAPKAGAQVTEVVVGITPTCPYGLVACWAGAYEALTSLDGVETVDKTPNAYNCTAVVRLKQNGLPDPDQWAVKFKSKVDQVYLFRGVEVTAAGTVVDADGKQILHVPGVAQPLSLKPLEHKLQWNSKKNSSRQPEPDERDAHGHLLSEMKRTAGTTIEVTGTLRKFEKEFILEVREFLIREP